jgi:hypothetical protein
MVFDGVGNGLQQGNGKGKMASTMRGQEGGARRGNATTSQHNERMIGQHNKRTTRDDATTRWCNKTMRGRPEEMTDDDRAAQLPGLISSNFGGRGEVPQQEFLCVGKCLIGTRKSSINSPNS